MLNSCQFIGNLGSEVELKYTPQGTALANFRLAVNRVYFVENERREEVEWVRVVAWGKLAETCNAHLDKGRQVYVEGRLSTRSWDGPDGQKRYMTEVVANRVLFLGKAAGGVRREQEQDDDLDLPFNL